MKLVTFRDSQQNERLGILANNEIFDLQLGAAKLGVDLPDNMTEFLKGGDEYMVLARKVANSAAKGNLGEGAPRDKTALLAPVPYPTSCRDGYAFRQHVATARRNRGVEMIPEFDQYPVFYFTNHNAVFGEGDLILERDHFEKLDFELECAVVIGKQGRNVPAENADSYIAGYMVMNDLSARVLQMEEMRLNLGPAKGKDFATALGPWLVTIDEFRDRRLPTPTGDKYDLRMTAYHNGRLISNGNLKDMNWTFAEIIERASYGVEILPGDVIGSGTVGTGCYLELNGTNALEAKARGEEFTPAWLQPGDTIELEIEKLGRLKNRVLKAESDYSILAKKKNV
jgi:fumarylacetoacetate (FAA) hydrolase